MKRILLVPLLVWVLTVLLIPGGRALAHPHVYVDASLTFVLDESGLTSMREKWLFDDIFSQAIMADLGLDAASLATPAGQEAIRTGAFAYLANYGYFTLVETCGVRIPVTEVEGFRAGLADGRLVYEFTVPLNLGFDRIRDFRAGVFDKEYYTDILLVPDAVRIESSGPATVASDIRPAKEYAYWQFIVPELVHLSISGAPGSAPDPTLARAESREALGPIQRLMAEVRAVQKELNLRLNGFASAIKADPFGPALWTFLGLAFLYGVVHAVGPGHGKTVVCSYFLSNPGSFFSGALMGNAITFVHMLSAAVAVGVAYMLFSSGMGGFQAASRALQPASYALLVLMGVFLTGKAVLDVSRGGLVAEPACAIDHGALADAVNIRRVLAVSCVTGLVPCPGAAVILAFSIGLNIFWAGMGALVLMAAGMGLTTTLFAWAAVAARGLTLRMSGRSATVFNRVYAGLSICGAASIAVFGAVLLAGSV
jgi:ABC-type nickel/cobalt efflux system permease component RcnA/ABC-type uncharacterized transport system substrate-binding protein